MPTVLPSRIFDLRPGTRSSWSLNFHYFATPWAPRESLTGGHVKVMLRWRRSRGTAGSVKKVEENKMCSTEPSHLLPDDSTTSARSSLTSLFGWEAVTLGGMAEWGVRGVPARGRLPQIFRTKAESQRIVATRPLCRVQYPVPYSSRLQGIRRPGSVNCGRSRLRQCYRCSWRPRAGRWLSFRHGF